MENSKEMEALDPTRDLRLSPYPPHTLIDSEVWLRPIFPDDWEGLLPIFTNPEKMKYFGIGKTLTSEELKERTKFRSHRNLEIKNLETDLRQDKGFNWAFFTHQGFSGQITVFMSGDSNRFEIAYCGSGGTAKATQIVLDYVKKPFLATVHPENIASRKVLEKLGFAADLTRQKVSKFNSIRDYYLLDRSQEDNEPIKKLDDLSGSKVFLMFFALCKFAILRDSIGTEEFSKN